ncbi:hypothetical protein BHM03_00027599, partial [Ensete ventricosum]
MSPTPSLLLFLFVVVIAIACLHRRRCSHCRSPLSLLQLTAIAVATAPLAFGEVTSFLLLT